MIVAIASGAAGVAGAVAAWFQAIKVSRLKAETDAALEKIRLEGNLALEAIKSERDRRRKAFEVAMQEAKPIEDALTQAWQDAQTMKDVIARLISPIRYDLDLALESIESVSKSLSEGYGRWGSLTPSEARETWHKMKNAATSIRMLLTNIGPISPGPPNVPMNLTDRLSEARLLFTDAQMSLAAARQKLREGIAQQVFEVL